MDPNTYAKEVYGLKVGDPVTPAMAAQIKKELEYYRKKKVDAIIDQEFNPKVLNTQQGMYAQYRGTNAVAIAPMTTNAQGQVVRGEPLRGYAAGDPAETGVVPTAGGGMFGVSNAATPTATPTPSPTPYPEGATLRKRSGENAGKLHKVVNGVPQLIPGQ